VEPDPPGFQEAVRELEIEGMPRHMQEDIVARVGETIFQAIIVTVAERLNRRGRKEFARVVDSFQTMDITENPLLWVQAINQFLMVKAPNLLPLIEATRKQEIALLKEAVKKA
jgi:hypothetical protein